MGGNGSGRPLTVPLRLTRSKVSIAELYPDALDTIREAIHPPTPIETRASMARWVAEMHDGKPTQRQANADGSNLPAPVIAIQIVAPLGTSPLPEAQALPVREMGPVLQMPQDATGEAREAFEGGEASPVPPVRVSPPSKRKSPPSASISPSEANLYGFGQGQTVDAPGAAPNTREARYAQRQARLRALMGQQGKG